MEQQITDQSMCILVNLVYQFKDVCVYTSAYHSNIKFVLCLNQQHSGSTLCGEVTTTDEEDANDFQLVTQVSQEFSDILNGVSTSSQIGFPKHADK